MNAGGYLFAAILLASLLILASFAGAALTPYIPQVNLPSNDTDKDGRCDPDCEAANDDDCNAAEEQKNQATGEQQQGGVKDVAGIPFAIIIAAIAVIIILAAVFALQKFRRGK